MQKKIQTIAMPSAIILGMIFHKWTAMLSPIMAILISIMLFFAYCRIDFKQLKIVKLHWILILIQYGGGIIILYALKDFNVYVAGSAMILFTTPVGASAMVLGNVLGGNLNSITSYNILSNIFTSVLCPIYFTLLNKFLHSSSDGLSIFHSIFEISKHVFILMLTPLLLAFILWRFWPKAQKEIGKRTSISFYIWVVAALSAFGKIIEVIQKYDHLYKEEIIISIAALVSCFLLFYLGYLIGNKFKEPITGSISLGQKNTILTIWMSHTFLTVPIFSIAAGVYMLFQNSYNSIQIYITKKKKAKLNTDEECNNPDKKVEFRNDEQKTDANKITININIENDDKPT